MSEPARDEADQSDPGPAPDAEAAETVTEDGPGLPPPTAVESMVNALLESGPEVAEHVVRAAQELLLAAQVVVDAAQAAVQEQQDLRASASAGAGASAGAAADENDEPATGASVHHLDRSE